MYVRKDAMIIIMWWWLCIHEQASTSPTSSPHTLSRSIHPPPRILWPLEYLLTPRCWKNNPIKLSFKWDFLGVVFLTTVFAADSENERQGLLSCLAADTLWLQSPEGSAISERWCYEQRREKKRRRRRDWKAVFLFFNPFYFPLLYSLSLFSSFSYRNFSPLLSTLPF